MDVDRLAPHPGKVALIAESAHPNLVNLSSDSVVDPLFLIRRLAATCRVCSTFGQEYVLRTQRKLWICLLYTSDAADE